MHAIVILAHPKPGSFNHALAELARRELTTLGYRVRLLDLYAQGFNPLLGAAELERAHTPSAEVREHADLVLAADAIVVVHPNWWSQAPAILKGWLDRVLRAGEAYRFGTDANGQGIIVGLLKARAALVFTTANTPQAVDDARYGDPLENFWKRCVWGFCGIPEIERRNFTPLITSTPETRAAWLDEAGATLRRRFGPPASA